jgi:hypothetical protein
MHRWHCAECQQDFCVDCRPTPRPAAGRKPSTANDLAAIVRTCSPPRWVKWDHHRLVASWCLAGNPTTMSVEEVAKRMIVLAVRHKLATQQELDMLYAMFQGQMGAMLFFTAYSAVKFLQNWMLSFMRDFAADENRWKHLLPVFKFLVADPNFASFGLGSGTQGTPNPNFAAMGLEPNTTFVGEMHVICDKELEAIAEQGEAMCEAKGFCKTLCDVGGALKDVHGVRLDGVVGDNALWLELENLMNTERGLEQGFDVGTEFCIFLEILNKVTENLFFGIVRPIVEAAGGTWKQAPPKNYNRMVGKLHMDHATEKDPKPCANIDGVRGGACFATPEALIGAFETLSAHASIRYLRVKNGFAQEKGNYGYRAVLVNMEFMAADSVTWGDILNSAETAEMLSKFVDDRCAGAEYERDFWEAVIEKAKAHAALSALPFRYIGEAQFLTDEYMAMRKSSHLWYKVKRQDFAWDLMNDMNKHLLPVRTRHKKGETALKVPKD